jgi:hypothetical protein
VKGAENDECNFSGGKPMSDMTNIMPAILSAVLASQNQGQQPSSAPAIDPQVAAKVAALAARNGGSQPSTAPTQFAPSGAAPAGVATGGMSGPAPDYQSMAAAALNNPMMNTIPQTPQAIPPGSPHPFLQLLLRAASSGLQNYGYGSMQGDQQQHAQQLAQQKAQALAQMAAEQERLGLQRQQVGFEGQRVGLEGQRVGYEGQRTAADVARSNAEVANIGSEMQARPALTAATTANAAAATSNAATLAQKAKDEAANATKERELAQKQFDAEYGGNGKVGLKAQDLAIRSGDLKIRQDTLDLDKKKLEETVANNISQLHAKGLASDMTAIEDARKRDLENAKDVAQKHFWVTDSKDDLAKNIQSKSDVINAKYDALAQQAQRRHGTAAGVDVGGALDRFNPPGGKPGGSPTATDMLKKYPPSGRP